MLVAFPRWNFDCSLKESSVNISLTEDAWKFQNNELWDTLYYSLELSHLSALQLSAPEVALSSILVNSTLKCHIIITWCCVVITYYTNDSTAKIDSKFSLYQWPSSHFSKLLRIKRPSCQIATSIKYQIHKIWYLQKERFAPTIELSAICC